MPVISMFYGIIVSMYFMDNKKHHAPHIDELIADWELASKGNTLFKIEPLK
jgi:hypothetical protein